MISVNIRATKEKFVQSYTYVSLKLSVLYYVFHCRHVLDVVSVSSEKGTPQVKRYNEV